MNSLTSLDTLIAISAMISAAIAIVVWARHVAKAAPRKDAADDINTPASEREPQLAEEPAQYLILPSSQYPAHMNSLAFVPMHVVTNGRRHEDGRAQG